jgi:MFS family permease
VTQEPELIAVEDEVERRWLTRGVASVGLASFFSDSGHEIVTSILPTFVTTTLHATPGALGLIEGISDALTGIAKLLGGSLANDPRRRLTLASGGYLVTAAATGAIGLAGTVWQVGLARAGAWSARGLRSPARDSLLASLAPPEAYGRAFGLERAGDNLGAVAGPLLAAGLVTWVGIRHALYLSALPGRFAALSITVAAAEARKLRVDPERGRIRLELRALFEAGLGRPLLPIALFELGNMATTLLILRATTLLHHGGRTIAGATALAVLIYAGHNLFGSFVAYAGGHWIDRAGPRVAFAAGAALYALAYAGFALPSTRGARCWSRSCSPAAGSGWRRRRSPRSSPGRSPTACAAAASACSRRAAVAWRLRLVGRRRAPVGGRLADRRLPVCGRLDGPLAAGKHANRADEVRLEGPREHAELLRKLSDEAAAPVAEAARRALHDS